MSMRFGCIYLCSNVLETKFPALLLEKQIPVICVYFLAWILYALWRQTRTLRLREQEPRWRPRPCWSEVWSTTGTFLHRCTRKPTKRWNNDNCCWTPIWTTNFRGRIKSYVKSWQPKTRFKSECIIWQKIAKQSHILFMLNDFLKKLQNTRSIKNSCYPKNK